MLIKTCPSFYFFHYAVKTNFAGMMPLVRVKAREIYAASQSLQLEVTGPLYWIYEGNDGNPETIFLLRIGIPVTNAVIKHPDFSIIRKEPFKCAYVTHDGSWADMQQVYGHLMQEIYAGGNMPVGENRELYLNMDFEHDANNITEIQVGIKPK